MTILTHHAREGPGRAALAVRLRQLDHLKKIQVFDWLQFQSLRPLSIFRGSMPHNYIFNAPPRYHTNWIDQYTPTPNLHAQPNHVNSNAIAGTCHPSAANKSTLKKPFWAPSKQLRRNPRDEPIIFANILRNIDDFSNRRRIADAHSRPSTAACIFFAQNPDNAARRIRKCERTTKHIQCHRWCAPRCRVTTSFHYQEHLPSTLQPTPAAHGSSIFRVLQTLQYPQPIYTYSLLFYSVEISLMTNQISKLLPMRARRPERRTGARPQSLPSRSSLKTDGFFSFGRISPAGIGLIWLGWCEDV